MVNMKYKESYLNLKVDFEKLKNLSEKTYDIKKVINESASRMFRINSNIKILRTALDASESVLNPTYFTLQQIYNEVIMDSEVTSVIQKRKNYILGRDFSTFIKGELNSDIKQLFEKKWFNDYINYVLDSIFYGYSLIKIGDIVDDQVQFVELIHRQNVNPKTNRILDSPYQINSGIEFTDKKVSPWFILASDSQTTHYQGLLSKLSTYQILLKIAQQAMLEYSERFGCPNVIVKTGMVANSSYIQNIENYLANYNRMGYGIFSNQDEIQLVESSGKSADIYIQSINEMKQNINKLVLGTETLGSEQSFVGSANISESIANLFSLNDIRYVEYYINEELIPKLNILGLPLKDVTIKFDISNKTKPAEEFTMMMQLIQAGYKVDAKILKEKFGVDVENPVDIYNTPTENNIPPNVQE